MEAMIEAFGSRISQLEQLLIIRSDADESEAEMSALDVALQAMELHLQAINDHLKKEANAFSKAKALSEISFKQEERLQHIFKHLPLSLPGSDASLDIKINNTMSTAAAPSLFKDRKAKMLPRRYVSEGELASLSNYMKGRLTLDKINGAIDEMLTFAENNLKLLSAPRKKLGEEALDKVLELRDISVTESVKGRGFFLESDMKGQFFKLDNTGKAILTILRHLGRVWEFRIGRHRVFVIP